MTTAMADVTKRKGLWVGGSDAPALLGVDPWRTPARVWDEKMGLAPPREQTKDMERGIYLEPIARRIYTEETGRRVRRHLKLVVHPDRPWMIGHIDGDISADPALGTGEGTGVLELKCPNVWVFGQLIRTGLSDYAIVQMQHYLSVTGRQWGSFGAFNSDRWKLEHFDVARDEELIDRINRAESAFYGDNLLGNTRPPDEPVEPPPDMPKVEGKLHTDESQGWADLMAKLLEARELRDEGKAVYADRVEEVQAFMELVGFDVVQGPVEGENMDARIYYKQQAGRVTFKRDLLAAAAPIDPEKLQILLLETAEAGDFNVKDLLRLVRENCTLDLMQYERRGKPFKQFRPFFLPRG